MYIIIIVVFIGILIFFWTKTANRNSKNLNSKDRDLNRSKGEQFNPEYSSKPDDEKKESTYKKKE